MLQSLPRQDFGGARQRLPRPPWRLPTLRTAAASRSATQEKLGKFRKPRQLQLAQTPSPQGLSLCLVRGIVAPTARLLSSIMA
jgi:hypothetical protein